MADETTVTPENQQAQQPAEDLTPVQGTAKSLSVPPTPQQGAQPPQESTEDLTPVEGTAKSLTAKPEIGAPGPGKTYISARPHTFQNWLEDVQADVKNGTDTTLIGSMLKKLGAKGTNYGEPEAVGDFMAGPALGVPKALEALPESYEAHKALLHGDVRGYITHGERSINKGVGGVMQSVGPVIAASSPEALAIAVPAMKAQDLATQTAKYFGADDDTAELIGNTTGILAGTRIHTALEVENFENAANARLNAESLYKSRAAESDIARQQAEVAQQKSIEAAQRELNGQGTKADTDLARTTASEAAKNAADAKKALDIAVEERAEATVRLRKFSRTIAQKAAKRAQEEADLFKSQADTARENLQKAIPAKGTDIYQPDENGNYTKYEIIRSHLEAAKERGEPVDTILGARDAAEEGRQGIEKSIEPYIDKYGEETLVDKEGRSPKMAVQEKLDEMAKVDGNFKDAMDYLSDFNVTDLNVKEGQELLTKLNDYMRAQKKLTNNWDIYNQIETNPKFAAYYLMADHLRDSLYDRMEAHDVPNIRQARTETAALIDFRNAADAQLRRNAGQTTVRGSGSQNRLRNMIAQMTGKSIKAGATAYGAEIAGPKGAVLGSVVGDQLAQPVQEYLAPGDLTRDEHVAKSMKVKGTNRKPAAIPADAGTPAVPPPVEPIPPAPKVKKDGPSEVKLAPRENTELHAELAAHYGLPSIEEVPYADLENALRDDIADKRAAGAKVTPAEQKLIAKVHKLDAQDNAARAEAAKTEASRASKLSEEAADKDKKDLTASDAWAGKEKGDRPTEMNPVLKAEGRGKESALVSHPANPEMMAHSTIASISDLPKGLTAEDVLRHEFAHVAIGAVDGLEPLAIYSDQHPVAENTHAAAVFHGNALKELRDANGNVNPEVMSRLESQWLTMKMAGPASHEIFNNMTRDELKGHSAMRGDFRDARAIVREVHPEFSPSQVEAVVDAAYDRARNFLTKKYIADRVRANASVRENNLSPMMHASPARISQFVEDIRKAHDDTTGSEPSPSGGRAGEGGEKSEKTAAEGEEKNAGRNKVGSAEGARGADGEPAKPGGGTRVEKSETSSEEKPRLSDILPEMKEHPEIEQKLKDLGFEGLLQKAWMKLTRPAKIPAGERPIGERGTATEPTKTRSLPPERSTGRPEVDAAIKEGGAIPGGLQKGDPEIGLKDLALFHDPESGTTLAYHADTITAEKVKEQIDKSRALYAKYEKSGVEKEPEFSGKATDFVGEEYLPEKHSNEMYHVTTNTPKVLSEGLKSRKQTGSAGLGGGFMNQASDKVSVTFDEGHANTIADRVRLAVQAAQDKVSPREVLDHILSDAGISDDTPHDVATALGAPEETREDWEAFEKWFDEHYAGDAYGALQDLDDALPRIYSESENPVRVGFTASKKQVAKINPDEISILKVEGRKGAKADHIPDEAELRFKPEDLRVVKE